MRCSEDAGDEHQPDDDVQPLLHHLPVGARKPDEQIGQQSTLYHLPDAFDPKVNGPPAVEDADCVVVELEERGEIEQGRETESRHEHSFGRRPASGLPDGHEDVEQKHQHDHDDAELERERLLEEFVSRRPSEYVTGNDHHTERGPEAQLPVGEPLAVDLGARFFGDHIVGGAHESGEDTRRSAGSCESPW